MKLATWNVNSLRARKERLVDWLERASPDVVCLQETKVIDADFPRELFAERGYRVAFAGQKTYNGVAIAARAELEDVQVGLCEERPEDGKRVISALVSGVRVYSVYVPNGRSIDAPEFGAKLDWLRRLRSTLDRRCSPESDLAVCGDFNIAPDARDVYDAEACAGQLHFHPDEHGALSKLCAFGLKDALRLVDEQPGRYSWWDYRAGAYRRDEGLRIDHLLISESLSGRCREVVIEKRERGMHKPSDHAPVVATFD